MQQASSNPPRFPGRLRIIYSQEWYSVHRHNDVVAAFHVATPRAKIPPPGMGRVYPWRCKAFFHPLSNDTLRLFKHVDPRYHVEMTDLTVVRSSLRGLPSKGPSGP